MFLTLYLYTNLFGIITSAVSNLFESTNITSISDVGMKFIMELVWNWVLYDLNQFYIARPILIQMHQDKISKQKQIHVYRKMLVVCLYLLSVFAMFVIYYWNVYIYIFHISLYNSKYDVNISSVLFIFLFCT